MKPQSSSTRSLVIGTSVAALLATASQTAYAAVISKANNANALNLGTSWVGGVVPGAKDVGIWDATVPGANSTVLGADLSWKGVAVEGPGGAVTIGGANVLALGTSGIDLRFTTQNLTLSSSLTLGQGGQSWSVPSGFSITLNTGAFTRTAGTALNLPDVGTVNSTMTGLANTNAILGPWASTGTGTATRFATLDGSNNIVGFTGGTAAAAFGWPSGNNNTFNYDVAAVQTNLGVGRQGNTARYTGAAGAQNWGNNNTTTVTLNGLMNAGTGVLTFAEAGGAHQGQLAIGTNNGHELVLNPASAGITIAIPIINTGANAGSILVTGPNTVTINSAGGASTYTGATTVAGGTLLVSGVGAINSTSGITVKGVGAKYVHTSSVASTAPVTLSEGTLDGTGTLGAVTVANNSDNILANGNLAATTSLTMGSLAFGGAATVNARLASGTTPVVVTGALSTTPANGTVTVNVDGPALPNGTHSIISSTGFAGGAASNFTLGTVTGLSSRQTPSLTLSNGGNNLALLVTGDSPVWTGSLDNRWTTEILTSPKNWKLATAGTSTDFLSGDNVLFNDTAAGGPDIVINISDASIAAGTIEFNNSSKSFTVSTTVGAGIAGGSLTKNGTNTLTLLTTNSYTGPTTINAGTLRVGDGTTDGSISATSNIVNNGSLVYDRTTGSTFTYSGVISGTGSVTKAGPGTQVINGANTFTGGITVSGGTLTANAGGVAANAISMAAGTTWNISGLGTYANTVTSSGAANVNFTNGGGAATLSGDWSGFSGTYTHSVGPQSTVFANALAANANTAYVQAASGSSQGFIMNVTGGATLHFGSLATTLPGAVLRNAAAVTAAHTAEIGALNTDTTWAGVIGGGGGTLNLTKVGTGTLTLGGVNVYNGNTVVSGGTLALADNAALRFVIGANGVNNAISGAGTLNLNGDFTLDTAGANLTPGNSWTLVNVGTLTETFGATFTVTGFTESANVWTKVEGSNTWTFTEATGVLSIAASTGYNGWASTNAGGQGADLDFDADGVANGIEYFMNSGAGFTANPAVNAGVITWPNGGNIPSAAYGTQFVVQTSDNLSTWTDVPVGSLTANTDGPGGSLTYTLPIGLGKWFVRLKVTPN